MSKGKTIPIILFLMVLAAYSYFFHFIGRESWNASSRLDLVYSLAEYGTFRIDPYHHNTGDKVFFGGYYYSDKAPGPSLLAVPFYFCLKWAGVATEQQMRYGLTLLVIGLPSAAAALLFYGLVGMLGGVKTGVRLLVTLAYALGTLAFPFSTVFYGHQLAAALLIAAFYLLLKIKKGRTSPHRALFCLSGFLAGWAYLSDYPAALLLVFLGIYSAAIRKKNFSFCFWLLGAAVPVAFSLYYNHRCFGSFLATSYSFHQTYSHYAGLLGIGRPKLAALWGITFSPYRGVFYQAPFLLAAFPGFYLFSRRKDLRAEFFLCLAAVLAFFLFNAGYAYWDGVGSVGARFLIPVLPFLVLSIVGAAKRWPASVLALVLLSFAFMLAVSATEPRVEWKVNNPLFYFNFFLLGEGNLADNLGMLLTGSGGWFSLLPLLLFLTFLVCLAGLIAPGEGRLVPGRKEAGGALGILALALFWIVAAGWEEPYLREYDKAESKFRYYRGRGYVPWEELENRYRAAIEYNPDFIDPYLRLAEIARLQGKPRLALAYYDNLLRMNPQSSHIRREKAILYGMLGENGKAEALLRQAAELSPGDASLRNQLAEFYRQEGRLAEAVEEWEASLKIAPGDKRVRLKLKAIKEQLGDKLQISNSKSQISSK